MGSVTAATGSRTNPAQLAASERRARAQEQDAVSVASPGSNPKDSSGKPAPVQAPATSSTKPTLDQVHMAQVDAKAQTQAENQQAAQAAGIPEVYGQIDPTRTGQVFSLKI